MTEKKNGIMGMQKIESVPKQPELLDVTLNNVTDVFHIPSGEPRVSATSRLNRCNLGASRSIASLTLWLSQSTLTCCG